MTFLGEHLNECRAVPFDWRNTHFVVVSGSGPNPCGHALVNAGAYYFHIDGLYKRPWCMNHLGYQRYLRENDKKELRRRRVHLSNPEGAQRKIDELAARRWAWVLLPNNCASFVEEVLAAGGSRVTSFANCPKLAWG
jgi:hypothetical protein